MKLNLSIGYIALTFLVSGCYTTSNFTPLNIEILRPPIFGPAQKSRIAILYNNSNFRKNPDNSWFIFNEKIRHDSVNSDSIASVIYYESFLDSLKKSNYYDTITDLGRNYPDIGNDSIILLKKKQLDEIRNTVGCNLILTLDQFSVNDISFTNSAIDQAGISFYIRAIWVIYNLAQTKNTLILHKDTLIYSRPYKDFSPDSLLKDRPYLLAEASTQWGSEFALNFVPHWQEVQRLCYQSGDLLFREADEHVRKNEWMDAARIWKPLTANKNKNIAAKSMFNLAIACEMDDDMDAAIDWVTKSYNVFGLKNEGHARHCQEYLKILHERQTDLKQFEPIE